MATEVLMPRQGQSVESCLILAWKKTEGDTISKGDVICEVETDKATFEVEAPADGTVLRTLFAEGDDVPVLTPIAYIGEPGEAIPAGSVDSGSEPAARESAAPVTSSIAESPAAVVPTPEPRDVSSTDTVSKHISPRARNLARAKGVREDELSGTGPGGRIIERDVQAALGTREPMTPAAIAQYLGAGRPSGTPPQSGEGPGGRLTRRDIESGQNQATETGKPPARTSTASSGPSAPPTERPVKGIRKLIAERMHASLRDTAQLTMTASADARSILAYRRRLKASDPDNGLTGITINDLVHFAVAKVLLRHPEMNATLIDEVIREYGEVHLGFAVDTPRGLMVPVIRNAQSLSLKEISDEAKRLGAACLQGNIDPVDLSGATFTVTNLGNLGIETFTPVLNAPQVGILGVCAVQPKPVMKDENVEFVPSIGLSLTIDHRAVDGAPGARFLQSVSVALRDIDLTLAR